MDITIPGTAYYECLDPLASGMASDLKLPEPSIVRAGRGVRVTYKGLTPEQVRAVGRHFCDMGDLWLNNSDPEFDKAERARYRVLVKTGERLVVTA